MRKFFQGVSLWIFCFLALFQASFAFSQKEASEIEMGQVDEETADFEGEESGKVDKKEDEQAGSIEDESQEVLISPEPVSSEEAKFVEQEIQPVSDDEKIDLFDNEKIDSEEKKVETAVGVDQAKEGVVDQVLTPADLSNQLNDDDSTSQDSEDNVIALEKFDKLMISEICPSASDSVDNDFVEIFNASSEEIQLEGCSLKKETSSGTKSNLKVFSKSDFALARDWFVWAKRGSIFEEKAQFVGSSYLSESNCVILECLNEEIDKACFADFSFFSGHSLSRINLDDDVSYLKRFASTPKLTPGEKNEFFEFALGEGTVYFNEIFSNPDGSDSGSEWVEIFSDNEELSFDDWIIVVKKLSNPELNGSVFVIDEAQRTGQFLVVKFAKSFLRNSDLLLQLFSPVGDLVDETALMDASRSGQSFNRDNAGKWSQSRFVTPGSVNRINQPPKIKMKIDEDAYKDIYVNFDASGTKDPDGDKLKYKWDFGDGHASYLKETKHRYDEEGDYLVTLRVDDGNEYFYKKIEIEVKSYPKLDIEVVGLRPNPLGKDSGSEIVYLKNNEKKKINLFGWFIASGKSQEKLVNHQIYEDFFIKPGQTIALMNEEICKFSLLNEKGQIQLLYPNKKMADKVKYQKDKIEEDEEYLHLDDRWQWVCQSGACVAESNPRVLSAQKQPSKNTSQLLEVFIDRENRVCLDYRIWLFKDWENRNQWWLSLLKNVSYPARHIHPFGC